MAPQNSKFFLNITPFEGDPQLLNFFFDQISEIQSLNKWSEAQTIAFLKTKIGGVALKYYIESSNFKNLKTVEEIKIQFQSFFKQDTKQASIQNLNSLRLLPGESIINLSHRLDVLVDKVYPEIEDAKALDAIKFQQFLSAIPVAYKTKILESNISNYGDAINKAQLTQDIQAEASILNVMPNEDSVTQLTAQINALQQEIQNFKQEAQKQTSNHQKENHYVNNHNRYKSNRFHRKDKDSRENYNENQSYKFNNRRQINKYRRPNVYARPQQCAFCGKNNHLMKDCYQFKRVISNSNNAGSNITNQNFPNVNARPFSYPEQNLN